MKHFSAESIMHVFGYEAKNYAEISKLIFDEISSNKSEYSYIENSKFLLLALEKGIGWANKTLAFETLQRAYIATITGYLRQSRWIHGIITGIEVENYHVFTSAMRGYLESATDLYDGLYPVPFTLAENYKMMESALSGEFDEGIIKPEKLEDILIHFQEARKKHEYTENFYSPKSARKYMETDHLKHLDLYKCYGKLCEVTHPAGDSLDVFLINRNYKYSFVEDDTRKINKFIDEHIGQFSELFMMTDNLCIIILKLINKFNIDKIYSNSVEKVNLSSIKAWNQIEYMIK